MQKTELRIGNWVLAKGYYTQIKTSADIDAAELFRPIALTREWLFKFGFMYEDEALSDQGGRIYRKDAVFVLFGTLGSKQVYLNEGEIEAINHVHQLQNFYFFMTGAELTRMKWTFEEATRH